LRTRNEVEPPVPARPQLNITPETPLALLGSVRTVLGTSVIVAQNMMAEARALDLGSILVLESRQVLGEVFDTFGPVAQPLYTVRFQTEQELLDMGVAVGARVFFLQNQTQFVATQELRKIKGSDASNLYDEEVSEGV
ncbi:H/ACA ribonucleo protein complex, subunit Gar1/Naf1, partial [Thamnocephalis sphaerospora]